MIFCAKFYFSAQMATMAIGNANPDNMAMQLLCHFRMLPSFGIDNIVIEDINSENGRV